LNSPPEKPTRTKWISSRKSVDKGKAKNTDKNEGIRSTIMQYLRSTIIKLENQQAAESIKYVIDCKRPVSSGGICYCKKESNLL